MWKALALLIIGIFALSMAWLGGTLLRRQAVPSTLPLSPSSGVPVRTLLVGTSSLSVEIADTPERWRRGLSGRDTLSENSGMLFVFPEPKLQTFWMKNTRIPLDILWVREGRVVGITNTMQPEPEVPDDQLQRYPSSEPVEWVIEVNAGWVESQRVRIGDSVVLAN